MSLLIAFVALIVLDVLAVCFGVDSRDGVSIRPFRRHDHRLA